MIDKIKDFDKRLDLLKDLFDKNEYITNDKLEKISKKQEEIEKTLEFLMSFITNEVLPILKDKLEKQSKETTEKLMEMLYSSAPDGSFIKTMENSGFDANFNYKEEE